VVPDHELGTNDCRGWLRKSLFDKLSLPDGRFYQFRLAFAQTQAKGSFKIMADEVADALDTDVILPVSSVKPEYKGPSVATEDCAQLGPRYFDAEGEDPSLGRSHAEYEEHVRHRSGDEVRLAEKHSALARHP